jgi:hypothetical protein
MKISETEKRKSLAQNSVKQHVCPSSFGASFPNSNWSMGESLGIKMDTFG